MKNQQIVLLGSGGHALSVLDTLSELGLAAMAIVDPDPSKWKTSVEGVPVVGSDTWLEEKNPEQYLLVNGLGTVDFSLKRFELYSKFKNLGFRFLTLVHPRAIVSKTATIAEGAQIMAGAVVQAAAKIGENTLINTGALVDHQSQIGDHCHIATGVRLSGQVVVGNFCHIGTGATVIQGVQIGPRSLVAAGAVVVKSLAAESRAFGVPAATR